MAKPRYQDVRANTIPVIETAGARIRLITGTHHGELGPVGNVAGAPTYLDVSLEHGKSFEFPVSSTSTVLLYILDGTVLVGSERTPVLNDVIALTERLPELKLPERSDSLTESVRVEAPANSDARFLFIAGEPLGEPIAWHGPIVMNTQEELEVAMSDLRVRNFIK